MSGMKYSLLADVYGRLEAEALKAFLSSEGIDVELIQEGVGEYAYPVTVGELGRVQVFVPNEKLDEARTLFEAFENGELDVDIAETNDLDEEENPDETEVGN